MKKITCSFHTQLADRGLLQDQILLLLQKTALTEGKILQTATGLYELARNIPAFPQSLLTPFAQALVEKNTEKILSLNTRIHMALETLQNL